ncbi:DUF1617 family protein [Enterococcus casseliflavus]|uniref:DUF1617 family protein n=1 Tax=Enterococcus TaxID=1350 RepID=UPI00032EECC2|nr:DUF1617 family protein [Enterococcus casseliflavus]DAF22315.1 MAG TPA: Protein of unknown function (DUF1617) [Caudoviricetes sp.]EOH79272.1 hypothetical protein UAM_02796 [Enterococcus casseliflavus ATCC 49996]EOU08921.1 hypothetical protein I582_02085 [Enterococcus casseliflavus ATCC 49996]MDT2975050.1 DUF1617 family protein [Enterococcus casseliflavus]MDT2980390.1 DUF1617 family protein [Enterococcus casseliflavus]
MNNKICIKLKNKEITTAINFLDRMNLKPKDSRHRSKFVKQLNKALLELSEEEKTLMNKFELIDSNGQLKSDNDRKIDNVLAFNREQTILLEEEIIVEGGMYAKNLSEVQRILSEYDGVLSGEEAQIYDRLMDEFESQDNE